MTNNEILRAIDASIKKWRTIVGLAKGHNAVQEITCPLCDLFHNNCTVGTPFDKRPTTYCPVYRFTGKGETENSNQFCKATSFYETTIWGRSRNRYTNKAENHMLSELYEVRRRFIASIHKRK